MRGYLHVRAGRLGLLLPVAGVLEVLEVERAAATAGHVPWRETSLPIIEGHELLGEPPPSWEAVEEGCRCPGVVYTPAPGSSPSMILVDRIAGLMPADDAVPLYRAPPAASRMFEATVAGEGGERLYCLRRPLEDLSFPGPATA